MPKLNREPKRPWKPKNRTYTAGADQEFYNSRKWRKASKRNLFASPLCLLCLEEGKFTIAEVTDHIKPISQGGDRWNTSNFQSLCISCHNRKRGKERWENVS